MFFRDKGMFFTSLITPLILLVLYATFLSNVYRDAFTSGIPDFIKFDEKLINGTVASQLLSSLLAVSCITVAFCSNLLSVQDKANKTVNDMLISPLKSSKLALGYYIATFFITVIVCLVTTAVGFIYVYSVGWYLSFSDVLLILADVLLLSLLGASLYSVVSFFLSTQGQMSSVSARISAGYGFICGAYMPISSFGSGLQKVVSFLPGTYATSLIRNHAMRGALSEIEKTVPSPVIEEFKNALDCNVYFFDNQVGVPAMFAILLVSIVILIGIYVFLNVLKKPAKSS
jgi:multidrug/hemolysin transport system permease protein